MADVLRRKRDHVTICLEQEVETPSRTGFERYRFVHRALPEIALCDVSLDTSFLGRTIRAPLLIASMTGGPERSLGINRNLARAAEAIGLPIAVGSQRVMFRHPEATESFRVVRELAPHVPVYGNLGAVQLNFGFGPEEVRRAAEVLAADGMFLHLNALQEAIQEEGDTDFRGLLGRIGDVVREAGLPVLVKESGAGLSADVAVELAAQGVAAIDVSGVGGTSWARVEGQRAADARRGRLGAVFADWGIPTAESLVQCRAATSLPIIASGGIRSGLDAAKALALGADLVSVALPLLGPAVQSWEAVAQTLSAFLEELRLAMFLTGARDVEALRSGHRLYRDEP